jgi:zinc D-Ala-D-Ala carboxypeptidase
MVRWWLISSTVLVVSIVNASDQPRDPALKTVTKNISLGHYVPSDLSTFNGIKMSKRIVPDLQKLLNAAQKDGLELKVMSGYRSYAYQENLFKNYVSSEMKRNRNLTVKQAEDKVNSYSARPGHSEHQLGTVVDVLSSENKFQFSSDSSLNYVGWLEKNASRWNFKISYTKQSKEYIYEPWHLRWYPPAI